MHLTPPSRLKTTAVVAALLFACALPAHAAENIQLTLRITVPDTTPANAKVFVCGNLPELGNWSAPGAEARPVPNTPHQYTLALTVPPQTRAEFKITRGSWQTVEKTATFEEIPNREFLADQPRDLPLAVTVAAWADAAPPSTNTMPTTKPSTVTGDLCLIDVLSAHLPAPRRVRVWLPPGYDASTDRYPVLYLHDGQNCFDAATSFAGEWQADETADRLIREKKIPPLIMVAVDNGGPLRGHEYTPTRAAVPGGETWGGGAEQYAQFIANDLKPLIDRTYRTKPDRENTAIAGSSLGGLNSLYLLRTRNALFSKAALVSPSFWWDNNRTVLDLEAGTLTLTADRLWLDMGTAESRDLDSADNSLNNARRAAKVLEKSEGHSLGRFQYLEVQGAGHNEAAWAKRFGDILVFLFAD